MKTGISMIVLGVVLAGVAIANVIGLSSGNGIGWTGIILPGIAGIGLILYGITKTKAPKTGGK